MLFRQICFSALWAGALAGLFYGAFHQWQIHPIIHAAEQFELTPQPDSQHGTASEPAWHPQAGRQRLLTTLLANMLIGFALALILLCGMTLHNLKSTKPKLTPRRGMGWGLALMLSLFIAPYLFGLHPEIPGSVVSDLSARQFWWTLCASATIAGLLALYYGGAAVKLGGALVLVAPYPFATPNPPLRFYNPEPAAFVELSALSQQFALVSSIGMLFFCLLLGALCGYASGQWVNLDDYR